MSSADKILKKMKQNPQGWRIEDVKTVAAHHGIEIRNPGGSHVILMKEDLAKILSVPARKPIKEIYIKKLIKMIEE